MMKNGEGTEEKETSDVTSPSAANDPLEDDELLPWDGQRSDGGDDARSSDYSSCGESEFERYCSANSVMGTPSFCSSVHEFPDSDFGSFKSFKLGGESGIFNNSGVDRKLSGFSEPASRGTGSVLISGKLGHEDEMGDVFQGKEEGLESDDFWSVKSFKLGGESGIFKNHVVDRKLSGFSQAGSSGKGGVLISGKMGHDHEMGDGLQGKREGLESDRNSEEFLNYSEVGFGIDKGRGEHNDHKAMGGESSLLPDDGILEKVKAGAIEDQTASFCVDSSLSDFRDKVEDSSVQNRKVRLELPCLECEDNDEASSRHEYSEGEDSMFGCASEGEQSSDPYFVNNVNHVVGAGNDRDRHDLCMTSDVAYGLNDWNDFMQESGARINMTAQDLFQLDEQDIARDEICCLNSTSASTAGLLSVALEEQVEDVVDTPLTTNKVHDIVEPMHSKSHLEPLRFLKLGELEQGEDVDSFPVTDSQSRKHIDYHKSSFISSGEELDHGPVTLHSILQMKLDSGIVEPERGHRLSCAKKMIETNADLHHESLEVEIPNLMTDQFPDSAPNEVHPESSKAKDWEAGSVRGNHSPLLADNTQMIVMDIAPLFEDHFSPNKRANAEGNGFFDEMVHEMEEILLDTATSPGSRSSRGSRIQKVPLILPSRDGGSTASTSGSYDAYTHRIKDIEVVGARQKKGDVSLSERLVGVKEHTIYKIRVWSGEDVWEIERRYRDFLSLYRMLKKLFADRGWNLPAPWLSVERESSKIFGSASPEVIEERSVLMQDCLRSIIHYEYSNWPLNAMLPFLWPSKSPGSPTSASITRSLVSPKSMDMNDIPMLGTTVSLIVQTHPHKSIQQILDAQCHTCAGCHKNFNLGSTRMTDLARTLGWGKPRLCEYSGQLFCSACHTNDMAVLPAKVLHQWDFTRYPVSQLAKSYLHSIYDKPMLCVSAVNPFLFSRVPALQHVTTVRKRIGAMIPYVRCSFRRSVYKALGSRRYLLDSNDFFALRDLIDLSKGIFAALPVMVETISRKILEHIMEQCLVCCDAGIPCNARQACNDPSSLIFPFQEGEVEKCWHCNSVFHRHCFSKIATCPCGARLRPEESKGSAPKSTRESGGRAWSILSTMGKEGEGETSVGFIPGLLSKMMPQRSLGNKKQESEDNDTVLLMGALPSNSL